MITFSADLDALKLENHPSDVNHVCDLTQSQSAMYVCTIKRGGPCQIFYTVDKPSNGKIQ